MTLRVYNIIEYTHTAQSLKVEAKQVEDPALLVSLDTEGSDETEIETEKKHTKLITEE